MPQVKSAIDQIRTARIYTKELLKNIRDEDWFRQPTEDVTHVAWQVGHLAVCEYGLGMKRIRGETELVSAEDRELFGKGSIPDPDAGKYPSPDEIRDLLDRVHKQTIEELAATEDEVFSEPIDPPHPMFKTKLGALHWCAQHEFVHAGQIGLLRRLLGEKWLR